MTGPATLAAIMPNAPFLMPLLVAFGLVKGAIADLANAGWAARIRDLEVKLSKVSV